MRYYTGLGASGKGVCPSFPDYVRTAANISVVAFPGACNESWYAFAIRQAAEAALLANPLLGPYYLTGRTSPPSVRKCVCAGWPGASPPTGTITKGCAPGYYPDSAFLRESCGSRPLVSQPDNGACFQCGFAPPPVTTVPAPAPAPAPECPSGWNTVCQPGRVGACVEFDCISAWSRKEYSQDRKCYRCVSTQRPTSAAASGAALMGNDGRWYAPDGLGGCVVWNGAGWCRP